MNLKNIKILLTESFIPFLFFLIVLFIALYYVDREIESTVNLITVSLEPEEDEKDIEQSIIQRIDLRKYPEADMKVLKPINTLLDQSNYVQAIESINKLNAKLKSTEEVALTLSYCYYKINKLKKGLAVLKSLKASESIRKQFNYGLIYMQKSKNYGKAIEQFSLCLKDNQYSKVAQINIALIYYNKKDYNQAIEQLNNVIKFDTTDELIYYRLGLCYNELNKNELAQKAFERAIRLNPKMLKARMELAILQLDKDFEFGLAEMKKIIKLDKGYTRPYYYIAKAYYTKEDNEQAFKYLDKGLKHSPGSIRLLSYLAYLYMETEDYQHSVETYQLITKEFADKEVYQFNLGRAFYGLDDYNSAIKHYRLALEQDPKYYKAYVNMAIAYTKLEKYKEALEQYEKAETLSPSSSRLYFNIAVLHSRLNNYKKVIEFLTKAIELDKNYTQAYNNLAYAHFKLNHIDKAIAFYNEAIKVDKSYANPYIGLGEIYSKDNVKKAIQVVKGGLQYSNSFELRKELAEYYLKNNNLNQALTLYEEFVNKNEIEGTVLLNLAQTYQKLGKFNESLETINRYLYKNPKDIKGRYVYMVTLYELKNRAEALKQLNIIESFDANYLDIKEYRKKLRY